MEIIKKIRNNNDPNIINHYDIQINWVDKPIIHCEFCTRKIITDKPYGNCLYCNYAYTNEIVDKIEEIVWNFDFDIDERIIIKNNSKSNSDIEELYLVKILNYFGIVKIKINFDYNEISLLSNNYFHIDVKIFNTKMKRDKELFYSNNMVDTNSNTNNITNINLN